MKKIIALMLIVLCIICGLSANADEIKNTIYNTDIIVYLDNKQIQGYAIDGKMMICVEDLRNYGYEVTYDDSIRALIANKIGEPSKDFNPTFKRGQVGGVAGYTYDTDIQVYINGNLIPAENIGGRMAVVAEDISDPNYIGSNDFVHNPYREYGVSKCGLIHSYDDTTRTLHIRTMLDLLPPYEEQLNSFLEGDFFMPKDMSGLKNTVYKKPKIESRVDREDCTLVFYDWEAYKGIAKFYRNGLSMDSNSILRRYGFYVRTSPSITSGNLSDSGNICYINGTRNKQLFIMSYETIESGIFEFDTNTFIIKLSENQ